jgi:uncharacterized protein with HEPN domain
VNGFDRAARLLADLRATLDMSAELVARGEDVYRADPAIPLAFEALSNRVGDLAKKLMAADPERFADPIWRLAARNRDYVVHHYNRLDLDLLWRTVTESFPLLRAQLA